MTIWTINSLHKLAGQILCIGSSQKLKYLEKILTSRWLFVDFWGPSCAIWTVHSLKRTIMARGLNLAAWFIMDYEKIEKYLERSFALCQNMELLRSPFSNYFIPLGSYIMNRTIHHLLKAKKGAMGSNFIHKLIIDFEIFVKKFKPKKLKILISVGPICTIQIVRHL